MTAVGFVCGPGQSVYLKAGSYFPRMLFLFTALDLGPPPLVYGLLVMPHAYSTAYGS
jgi:hypothetical protein